MGSSNHVLSKTLADSALQLSRELGYKKSEAEAIRVKGLALFYGVQYSEAMLYFIESKALFESEQDTFGICLANNLIAIVYNYQGYNEKSLEIHKENLELRKKIQDIEGISTSINNIAVVLKNMGKLQDALKYYEEAIRLIEKTDDLRSTGRYYNNIALLYLQIHNPDSAKHFLDKSLLLREKINDRQGIKNSLSGLGEYYYYNRNYEKAKDYFEKSLSIAYEIGIVYEIESTIKMLSLMYAKLGMYKRAYETHFEYKVLSDSLKRKETTQLLTKIEMETRFEKEREFQKIIQDKKDAENRLIVNRQKQFQRILLVAVIALLIVAMVTYRSFLIKKKNNKVLQLFNEEILQQKEEITAQRDEIENQKEEIEAQRDLVIRQKEYIEEQKRGMEDSIEYARTIQNAILPSENILQQYFTNYTIIYKPKDIVSGDFYWAATINNNLIVAVGDCTGHGVPGAFMTFLGITFLNEIVRKKEILHPAHILNELRKNIVEALKQTEEIHSQKDGMDISIAQINQFTLRCNWAGAGIPLWILRNPVSQKLSSENKTAMEEYLPDKMPVGIYYKMEDFNSHEIQLHKGDRIYMLTDGMSDQFGGELGKRLKAIVIKRILETTAPGTLSTQRNQLEKQLDEWMFTSDKKYEQTDDITLLAFEI
jgi:serine phosphatase RsbU (regulator of sigma subunit)